MGPGIAPARPCGRVFRLLLFIDNVEEEVLVFLKRLGAEFIAETSYALDVCERLDLPLAHEASQKHISGGSNGHAD